MQIVDTHLKIVPPDQVEQHDDTESRCRFRASLRNDTEQTQTVRLIYSLENDGGRAEHSETAVAVPANSTLEWEEWLTLWSRFESPQTVKLTGRLSIDGQEYQVSDSFEVEAGDRPRYLDPARLNLPTGGSLRGEV